MATLTSKAISELPSATSIGDTDLFALSQGGSSKKITAKTMREKLQYVRLFNTIVDLGLTFGSATIAETYAALPLNSMGIFVSDSFATSECPTAGTVFMAKTAWDTRGYIVLHGMSNDGIVYVKNIRSDGTSGSPAESWQLVLTGDTGWITATLTSSFTPYSGDANNTPRYRRIGNVVYISGIVTPATTISAATETTTIFTLPSGYRPTRALATICQGSQINRWALGVGVNGDVTLARYGSTARSDVPAGAWLPFSVQFAV